MLGKGSTWEKSCSSTNSLQPCCDTLLGYLQWRKGERGQSKGAQLGEEISQDQLEQAGAQVQVKERTSLEVPDFLVKVTSHSVTISTLRVAFRPFLQPLTGMPTPKPSGEPKPRVLCLSRAPSPRSSGRKLCRSLEVTKGSSRTPRAKGGSLGSPSRGRERQGELQPARSPAGGKAEPFSPEPCSAIAAICWARVNPRLSPARCSV